MATITTSTNLFPSELVNDVFNKVKGHSSIAVLSGQQPIPFAGVDQFIFSMDGEASIVGEGKEKPAGEAEFKPVTIKPIKFVYQHRLTDEFVRMSEEAQIPYLAAFTDGFSKKIARALDIAAFHGVNPADNTESAAIGDNCMDKAVTNIVVYDAAKVDENIDDAVGTITTADGTVTGIALAPAAGSALGKMKASGTGMYLYPEFRFGATPSSLTGMAVNINNTVSFKEGKDRAIIGDFANAVKWGFAENVACSVIEYGDPDGKGDLKRYNQIVLRAETYVGWGILDNGSFAIIREEAA